MEPGEFDILLERIHSLGIPYGTSSASKDSQVRVREDHSRSIYFGDPAGHDLEIIASR